MEFILIIAFILGYSSLSSKITRIASALTIKNKKRFSSLKEWIGKEIELETDDHLELAYGCKTKGILKEYNDTWIVIETTNRKKQKELYYYRLHNITSVNICNP